jgi:hypothetical protein
MHQNMMTHGTITGGKIMYNPYLNQLPKPINELVCAWNSDNNFLPVTNTTRKTAKNMLPPSYHPSFTP